MNSKPRWLRANGYKPFTEGEVDVKFKLYVKSNNKPPTLAEQSKARKAWVQVEN